MSKTKRARYTLEFKLDAARLVKTGQSVAAAAATLDVPAQVISNWVKAEQEGKLSGAGTKPVSPEQMELSRLRVEVARLKLERDILKKACTYWDHRTFRALSGGTPRKAFRYREISNAPSARDSLHEQPCCGRLCGLLPPFFAWKVR